MDAEANIGKADGPKGAPQERRVIQRPVAGMNKIQMDSGSRPCRVRNEDRR